MTEGNAEAAPAADPGNAPPEEWTGEKIDPEVERAMLSAAISADVRDQPYEVAGWEGSDGV